MLDRIQKARQAGEVTRYHTAGLIRREDVAQHSFNVVNLLLILTEGTASKDAILAALTHDMGERVVGDMPSPIKNHLPRELYEELTKIEGGSIAEIHPNWIPEPTDVEHYLVRLCDNLDGLMKCMDEMEMGNSKAAVIGGRYAEYVTDLLNQIGLFQDEIMPLVTAFFDLKERIYP